VAIAGAVFGGGHVGVIAGPCTIEDAASLRDIAARVAAAGAVCLRGGVFKVRTSPHSYQGGGLAALRELAGVAREVGLPFLTELTDPRQVEDVAGLVDGIQIGARHMQNFPLLVEAGRAGKPILLKRHMAADVDEWLLAAEYVLATGNERVILCERGLKSGERHVRYLLDVGVVPYLKQRVGLPVIVDPSHAAGDWRLVPPLARAAVAAGADGLIVEVHPRPEATRSDALQALPPDAFLRLMDDVRALAAMDGRSVQPARAGERSAVGT
jgi:3-deoxy-7-phosphoheptulonate synthase